MGPPCRDLGLALRIGKEGKMGESYQAVFILTGALATDSGGQLE